MNYNQIELDNLYNVFLTKKSAIIGRPVKCGFTTYLADFLFDQVFWEDPINVLCVFFSSRDELIFKERLKTLNGNVNYVFNNYQDDKFNLFSDGYSIIHYLTIERNESKKFYLYDKGYDYVFIEDVLQIEDLKSFDFFDITEKLFMTTIDIDDSIFYDDFFTYEQRYVVTSELSKENIIKMNEAETEDLEMKKVILGIFDK